MSKEHCKDSKDDWKKLLGGNNIILLIIVFIAFCCCSGKGVIGGCNPCETGGKFCNTKSGFGGIGIILLLLLLCGGNSGFGGLGAGANTNSNIINVKTDDYEDDDYFDI